MAKAVADVNLESQGGFASNNGNVTGFSHMHDSGTGGVCDGISHLLARCGMLTLIVTFFG